MQLTPENLHLVDARIDTDPDSFCIGCDDNPADSPTTVFYDITDFPGGTYDPDGRITLCADCLADDDGFTHDELVRNRALLDAARTGQPYQLDQL